MPLGKSLLLASAAFSLGAHATPTLEMRGAAVRVVIVPERRATVSVTVLHASKKLPLRIRVFGGRTFITGDIGHRSHGCQFSGGRRGVGIWGRGVIPYDALPMLVVRTPMDVRVSAGEAVFGVVGRSASLELTNQGCGGWTVANVAGHMKLDQAGSGVSRVGASGRADVSVAGSGSIVAQAIRGGVTAVSSGAGNISLASLNGPFDVRVAGSGEIDAKAGRAPTMVASIAGSGGIRFGGAAGTLRATIAGPGAVTVAHVEGAVTRQVFGAGHIRVGL